MVSAAEPLLAVTLDAGGTLIANVESVGETYARLARDAGIEADATKLDDGFRRAFAAAPPLAPPPGDAHATLLDFEHAWWRRVALESLRLALGVEDLAQVATADACERFFLAAFAHYAQPSAWRVDPDAVAVLRELRARGLRLAVVSNFDARLHGVLAGLGLAELVDVVLPSSEAGAAKPDPAIFRRALALLGGLPAARCLHVGDSLREDVDGATAAGLRAVWLDRRGASARSTTDQDAADARTTNARSTDARATDARPSATSVADAPRVPRIARLADLLPLAQPSA
ncbi:MAG TPA: HAD-IA family hydrolase [Candidatus Binatia bacterium]